jgi:hypothetical protein
MPLFSKHRLQSLIVAMISMGWAYHCGKSRLSQVQDNSVLNSIPIVPGSPAMIGAARGWIAHDSRGAGRKYSRQSNGT